MCDYSLHMQPNRLAVEGEQLVAHRFAGHTIGMASPADLAKEIAQRNANPIPRWSWAALKEWWREASAAPARSALPAVCVPPGARLRLHDIPDHLQHELGVRESEEVSFVQVTAVEYVHRDAVRFPNGAVALLQRLREGQRVDVLSLAPVEGSLEHDQAGSAVFH